MTIKVLLIDDHQLFLAGLKDILSHETDLEILGKGNSGLEAIQMAQDLGPDVIVMDVTMPDLNGIKATQKILENDPSIKILALSMYYDKQYVTNMLKAGASGYLIKDCAFDQLIQAIHTVVDNQMYLSPKITGIVVGDRETRVREHRCNVRTAGR